MTLPVADRAVRLARDATRDALTSWRLAHVEENAILLVSELVTNAVRHAGGTYAIALDLEAAGTWLRIEVQDADRHWPRPRVPAGFDESGFGFVLVDALAAKWGVRETATGKAVWAELDTRQPGKPRPRPGRPQPRPGWAAGMFYPEPLRGGSLWSGRPERARTRRSASAGPR
jgi:anti-sigma regulatory factor (Ser/Thr protein kinase)